MTVTIDPRVALKAATTAATLLPPLGVSAEEETASRYSSIVVSRSASMLFRTFPVHADELSFVGMLHGQVALAGAFDGLADAHG